MGVRLRSLPAAAGAGWIRQAFVAFRARPAVFMLAFTGMVVAETVVLMLPVVGAVVMAFSLPVVSLLFMMVTSWTLAEDPAHRALAATPLAATRQQRQGLAGVCALYATLAISLGMGVAAIYGDAMPAYFEALAQVDRGAGATAELPAPGPGVLGTIVTLYGGMGLLSLAFWHAPALVHWGGQGAAQALFSNALAVWRTRSAFLAYALGWAVIGAGAMLAAMLLAALGLAVVASLLLVPVGLVLFTVFYISLYFCFVDTFEVTR